MANLNFVPDDYVQSNESQRTNILYLVLFLIVMIGLGGAFATIKTRQQTLAEKEKKLNKKMDKVKKAIRQFEQLQNKKKTMAKTALMTAELIEPVPRSVLLASLTNNLPTGASLLKVDLIQDEYTVKVPVKKSNFENKKEGKDKKKTVTKKKSRLKINLQGIAPSDIQVASFLESLTASNLYQKVALVESREHKIDEAAFREFKLTAELKEGLQLTNNDINEIRSRCKDLGQVY